MPRTDRTEPFHTIDGLLEVLGDERRDKGILCQAVAVNGDAWNMFATFTPKLDGSDMSLLQLHHDDLRFLHQKFSHEQLAEYQKNLEEQMFKVYQYSDHSPANLKMYELMSLLRECLNDILPQLSSLESQANPSNQTQP
jgi:hypothetical protein